MGQKPLKTTDFDHEFKYFLKKMHVTKFFEIYRMIVQHNFQIYFVIGLYKRKKFRFTPFWIMVHPSTDSPHSYLYT